jgi:hypothetical protein
MTRKTRNKRREPTAGLIAAARFHARYALNLLDDADDLPSLDAATRQDARDNIAAAVGKLEHLRNRLGDQKAEQ